MSISKGGRGHKAAYVQETVKVPVEIKKTVCEIVQLARELITDGRLNDISDLNYFLSEIPDKLSSGNKK
jgi:formiminotetrahydrofolate cyclodeaminase